MLGNQKRNSNFKKHEKPNHNLPRRYKTKQMKPKSKICIEEQFIEEEDSESSKCDISNPN